MAAGKRLEIRVAFDGARRRRPFARSRVAALHSWSGSDRELVEAAAERLGTDPSGLAAIGALAYAKRVLASARGMAGVPAGERSGYVGARDADMARALRELRRAGKPISPSRLAMRAGVGYATAKGWLLRVGRQPAE